MYPLDNRKALSFTEMLVAVSILSVVLAGMMEMFIAFEVLGDTASKTHLALAEAQSKMEEIKSTGYSSIVTNYSPGASPGNTFSLNSLAGTGSIAIDNSVAGLLKITVNVSYKVGNNRVIGLSNSPVTITTYVAQH
ncbi:MAG: type IV pilus modification PilV family protein [Ginsengibacter sp.]